MKDDGGEKAQQLSTLAALGRGSGFQAALMWQSQPPDPRSRGIDIIFWSPKVPGVHALHIHTRKQTLIHRKHIFFKITIEILGVMAA